MKKITLKKGEDITKKSIIELLFFAILKVIVGFLTGLTVVIADAVSSIAETLSLFASYIGLRLSRKSEDSKFKYGYYKVETFMAFLISLGMIYLSYEIILESLEGFQAKHVGAYQYLAAILILIASFHSWKLSQKLLSLGEKLNSLSLETSGKDKRNDVFRGGVILISILANYLGIPYVESVVSILIALFIFKVGFTSAKESLFFLLDYWNDPKLYKQILKEFQKEKDLIQSVKKLRLRRAGTFIFGEVFIEINPFAGIEDLREELDLIQEKVKNLNPYIKDFSIFSHISKKSKLKIAVPIASGEGLKAKVANTQKETKAYVFLEVKDGNIKKFYTKKLSKKDKNPLNFPEYLSSEKVEILIDSKLNSLLYYHLRRIHHILIYPNFSDLQNVEDTVKLLLIDT